MRKLEHIGCRRVHHDHDDGSRRAPGREHADDTGPESRSPHDSPERW